MASNRIDLTGMLAFHDALRRDLVQVGRIADQRDDDPARMLQATLGWELFKRFLTVHHRSEDIALWPALRTHLADSPDGLAVVDAMEAEHAVIDPLLAAIDAAAADQNDGYKRFRDIVDELHSKLTGHLAHEEADALPLIDAHLSPEEWQRVVQAGGELVGNDGPTYLPWMLDGARPEILQVMLSQLPPPLVTTLREQWEPRYAGLAIWTPRDSVRSEASR